MNSGRKAAYDVLLAIEKRKAFSNLELNSIIADSHEEEGPFIRRLVYGVTENKLYLDYVLDKIIRRGIRSTDPETRTLLRMGAYQMDFMGSVPTHAAINETVNMAKVLVPGRDRFVNGVLRGLQRMEKPVELPDKIGNPIGYLSIKYSCHESIVSLMVGQYGEEAAEAFLEASNTVPPLFVRIGERDEDAAEALRHALEAEGIILSPSVLTPRCFMVKGKAPGRTKAFAEGRISIQSEESCWIADMVAPEKGHTVIDVCASPGGKTLAMAETMQGEGRIIACDIYPGRIKLVQKAAEKHGLRLIETVARDGRITEESWIGIADRVLVDAPCSGLGVLRRKPEIKYRELTEDYLSELTDTQGRIIRASSKYVKPGGRLIYSTCTVNKDENHKIVEAFIKDTADFALLEERTLMPGKDPHDGFYVAIIERLK